jgi:cytochrome c2
MRGCAVAHRAGHGRRDRIGVAIARVLGRTGSRVAVYFRQPARAIRAGSVQ